MASRLNGAAATKAVVHTSSFTTLTNSSKAVVPTRCFATSLFKSHNKKKERVVILGSGWAGYAFARTLDPSKYERIIVSPRSYFVFTPLLASTAVGTLEFRTTLESVRRLGDVAFHQGWADDVDFARKLVRVEENSVGEPSSRTVLLPPQQQQRVAPKGPVSDVAYDKLVVAVGAYSQTFGIQGVREHAYFLRDIGDARRIRLRVLSLFEQCASPVMSDQDRRKLLHFAIVGGGPTGIEYAAELHDLIHDDLSRIYPDLVRRHARVTVYDIAPKILPMFDRALASYAMGTFRRQGIDVRTGHSIRWIRPDGDAFALGVNGGADGAKAEIGAGIVVWSTGLMQNPLVERLLGNRIAGDDADGKGAGAAAWRLSKDSKTGGIVTDGRLRARIVDADGADDVDTAADASSSSPQSRVLDDVYVIGDCAVIDSQRTLPKTAQVASQEAAYLAKALNKNSLDKKPFKFRNLGTMTYLGSWKAIHQSSADHLTGWAAWVLWRTAYLTRSMSIKNKLLVPVYWFVSWAFGRDISRF